MKKKILVIYVIGIHLLLGTTLMKSDFIKRVERKLGIATSHPEITEHFYQMISSHIRMDGNVPDKSVIFIGDSITQGLAVMAVVTPSVNYGIGSDTTVGVLQRLSIYKSIEKASAVVIAIGLNDMKYRSNKDILNNLKTISEQIPKNIPVVFSAILPVNEDIRGDSQERNNNRIIELNSKLKIFTEKFNNLFFVDSGRQLIDKKGNLAGQFHEGDGVHLNSRGNSIWIRTLQKMLKNVQKDLVHGGIHSDLLLQ